MNEDNSARRLHESTKHGTPPSDPERLVDYRRLDPHNVPSPFKEYRDVELIELPRQFVTSSTPATDVLSGLNGETSRLDGELLSTLLFLSAGVTRVMALPDRPVYFRAAMSAGNLHPVEVYLVVGEGSVDGVAEGVYHFSPLEFALRTLRKGDLRGVLGVDSPLALVLTGIPWRTSWKYGERGWRHLYWDAGTMLANLLAVADAHGLEHRTLLGFDDRATGDLLGIDGATEMPLAIIELGSGEKPVSPPGDLAPLSLDVGQVAPNPIRLPLLEEAQHDSDLESGEVDAWRCAGSSVAVPAPIEVPAPEGFDDPIEKVVLRRGSTRKMCHQAVPARHLEWPLAAATRAVGIDAIPHRTLLDHYVNVHSVGGLDPGAYRRTDDVLQLMRSVEGVREQSASLCLGQALGGDSAYTVFHCAELEPLFSSLGARGYRVAQLEAGVVSGRLALCAFALGLGATGLTFFDDAVASYFGTTAEP
ncbi:MAG: SagB/ThcOx family dehydrogenase, partial [Actinomycetota bacterium]